MPAAQRLRRPGAGRLVVLELEHEPSRAIAGEEVLDRLRALAALAGRTHACAERDQRRTEVAALRAEAGRRTEVAADGRGGANLEVAELAGEARQHLVRAVGERRDRHHRADPDDVAVGAKLVQAAAMEQQRARRLQPARRDLGHQNRAAGEHGDPFAVAEKPSRLVGRARNERFRSHGRFYVRHGGPRQTAVALRGTLRACRLPRSTSSRPALAGASYLPDRGLSTALYLSLKLEKPLLLEGEAGVGKTEAAKAIAQALGARVIRLQCYEGLDVAHAVYEWNYARQLLHIRAAQEGTVDESELFGPEFLIRRPLLEAVEAEEPVVLLIDEVDRADEEFEAFLLEILSDFQITIPELGTIKAKQRPYVILTSNRTRELHDALKRRCLFHWIGHPSLEREIEIVKLRVPGVPERLAAEAAAFVAELRLLDLQKPPGLAETIDWAQALTALGRQELDVENVETTLGSVLKYHEDLLAVRDETLAGPRGKRPCPLAPSCAHIVTFGRVLREAGLEVGPGRVQDALRGLDAVELARQEDVYWTLRQTLVSRYEDVEAFDRAFQAWFLAPPWSSRPRRSRRSPAASAARVRRRVPGRRWTAARRGSAPGARTSSCGRRTSPR